MKKTLLSLLVVALFLSNAMAQDNNVKLNLGALGFKHVQLAYERALGERASVNLQLGYKLPSDLPTIVSEDSDGESTVKGVSIIPSFRMYSKSNGSFKGFYWGPYLKYKKLAIETEMDLVGTASTPSGNTITETVSADIVASYRNMGIGLDIGVQWIIADLVTIDWNIIGVGASQYTLMLETDMNYSNAAYSLDMESYANDLESAVSEIPLVGDNVTSESTANSLEVKAPFIMASFRMGFSVGVLF